MDNSEDELNFLLNAGASVTVITALIFLIRNSKKKRPGISKTPTHVRDLWRNAYIHRTLYGSEESCKDKLRMRVEPFHNLVHIMRNRGLLKDTKHVCVEEQLAMFLNIVGHKSVNRSHKVDFVRSGETISRYFNVVLRAICEIRDLVMHQPGGNVHPEIENNPKWYPYFKDCIGLIDGTHIDANVPALLKPRFRGRKGITQNVLAATTPDNKFTYVMAGWEGAANDFTILKDALSMPPPDGLKVMRGKYYLCDAGYTTMPGFIAPYRGVRYHLKEQDGFLPQNRKELFNLRHSSLRSNIESTFGVLKNRFRILSTGLPFHPFPVQVQIVLACCVLHNYISGVDPRDPIFQEEITLVEDVGNVCTASTEEILDLSQALTQREQREARNIWLEKRDNIARDMWMDYCREERNGDYREE